MQNPSVQIMEYGSFDQGTLTGTSYIQEMGGAPLNATVTLKSSDATRKIEISSDGGIEYVTPVYDQISATMLIYVTGFPISHVRFTGVANDTWVIR